MKMSFMCVYIYIHICIHTHTHLYIKQRKAAKSQIWESESKAYFRLTKIIKIQISSEYNAVIHLHKPGWNCVFKDCRWNKEILYVTTLITTEW